MRKKYKKLTKIEEKELINLYLTGKYQIIDLIPIFNVCRQSINNVLIKNKIEIRQNWKYYCNFDFFKKIDTEAKAYFLGLLYADGNVSLNKNIMQISLQDGDKHILEQFKSSMNANYPITSFQPKGERRQKQNYFRVCSPKIKTDLIKLGCIPAKSLILKFPTPEQVPDHLIHHFMRGYFDGDGGIKHRDSIPVSFMICGTKNFCSKYQKILINNCNLNCVKLSKNKKIFELNYGGIHSLNRIYDFLYRDATIYLNRKYNLFQIIKQNQIKFKILDIKNNNIIIVTNLQEFAIDNNCHLSNLYKTLKGDRGHHHGFKLIKIINPTVRLLTPQAAPA